MAKKMGAKCAVGGKVTGPGGVDKVPLQATAGEYMLPVKTVQAIGVPTLDALVRQTNGKEPGPKMVAGTERAATGGEIGKGIVDTVKNLFGFGAAQEAPAAPAPTRPYQVAPAATAPVPEMLGAGMAAGAGQALLDSQRRTREAIDGYANGGEVLSQEEQDKAAILRAGGAFGAGTKKLTAAAADVFTLPIRGVMGAANTLLRAPNAFGANIPYIPESAFGGDSSSMTPYYDKYVRQNAPPATAPIVAPAAQAEAPALPASEPVPAAAPVPPQQAGGPQRPETLGFVRPAPVQDTFKNTAKSGSLASFFGAAMNEKRLSQAEQVARDQAAAENAFNLETAKFGAAVDKPASLKNAYEAEILRRRIALADTMKDPESRAALLVGQAPARRKLEVPMALQPMPGSGDNQAVMFDPASGSVFRAPIKSQASLRRGSDGKTYVMGADGNPLREATPDELSSVSGQ